MVNSLENSLQSGSIRREITIPPPLPPAPIMIIGERQRLHWQHCITFLVFWVFIYITIVFCHNDPSPRALVIRDECRFPERFISERAGRVFYQFINSGPREVGSPANEDIAVTTILNEIDKIKNSMPVNMLYDIDTDVQMASGSFVHYDILNAYENIQNVVVLMKSKSSNSSSSLLINTHFDTAPRSPGAGGSASMVAVMIEVLRTFVTSANTVRHPIIFLFNGAGENSLQGVHAFITQHKWAENVKAVINLDSAGVGGRELLFQSGPNHPWLIKYYRRSAMHPFGSTLTEEILQAGIISIDTDFSMFKALQIPGLDMSYVKNGYVHRTPYDSYEKVSLRNLQNTGDNVHSIAKVVANSFEMENPLDHKDGYMTYYDFLGVFLATSTIFQSMLVEVLLMGSAIFAILVSLWQIGKHSNVHIGGLIGMFILICIIQVLSIVLAIGITIFIAITMDTIGLSMAWFHYNWMVFGLYMCPMIFGLGILPPIFLAITNTEPIAVTHKVKMFQHAHCIMLLILIPLLSSNNVRSGYLLNIAVGWYTISVILNLALDLHNHKYQFLGLFSIFQIIPFTYFCYIGETVLHILIPTQGSSGIADNPEIKVAAVCAIFVFLCMGFLIPLFGIFQKSRLFVTGFLTICLLTIVFAMFTPFGNPYAHQFAPQRFSMIHTRRVFHDYDATVQKSQPAFYLWPQDRHFNKTIKAIMLENLKYELEPVGSQCEKEMFCGFPLLNHEWNKNKFDSFYIPSVSEPIINELPTLEKLKVSQFNNNTRMYYEFTLTGPDRMQIFINPLPKIQLTNWSFSLKLLEKKCAPPFFIYLRSGRTVKAFNFSLEFQTETQNHTDSIFEIGIGAHWIHQPINRQPDHQHFINSFPKNTIVTDWISSYEKWVY